MTSPTTAPTETITLVTGANKGLGYETVRRLIEAGHTVLLGARDAGKGKQAADALGAEFVALDVTDDASVDAAADRIRARYGRLDVLVNNAGVVGPRGPLADTTAAEVSATLDANVLGVVRVTHAFLPLLRASANPRIVNVSSNTSRVRWQEESGWPHDRAPAVYSASKGALTMLSLSYAHALPGIRVNVAFPGYTATDLNDGQGTQTVTEGTDAIVRLATLPPDGPSGTVENREGVTTPW